jgi:anti-sigma-K factor RskA
MRREASGGGIVAAFPRVYRMRQRLESFVSAFPGTPSAPSQEPETSSASRPARGSWSARVGWSIAAVLAIALGAALALLVDEQKMNRQSAARMSDVVIKAQDAGSRLAGLEQQMKNLNKDYALEQARFDQMIRADVYPLTSAGQPGVVGKVMVDRVEKAVILAAENVKPPPAGKAYELWIISSDGRRMASGTQMPDAAGRLIMRATVPDDLEPAAAGVTIEDLAGSPAPTTPVQFSGKIARQPSQ